MKMIILHWLSQYRTSHPRSELDEILAEQQAAAYPDRLILRKVNLMQFLLLLLSMGMVALLMFVSLQAAQGAETAVDPIEQLNTPTGIAEGWQIQTVTARGETGRDTDLALDANGYPHISYIERVDFLSWPDDQLHHAYWDGVRWHIELIAEDLFLTSASPGFTSIALDTNGVPHFVYPDNNQLYYVYWDGSEWINELVDDSIPVVSEASLQVDSDNNPHISYIIGGDLAYAYKPDETWQTEIVDSGSADFTSLAIGTNDLPRISYIDKQTDVVNFAAYNGVFWDIQTVDSSETISGPTSLALTTTGTPHIGYIAESGHLKYAAGDWETWQIETVITLPTALVDMALSLDTSNSPHIVYTGTYEDFPLTYLSQVDGNWQSQILDPGTSLHVYNALAVDNEGEIHVSYFDYDYSDLRYVTWDPNWIIHPVQAPGFKQAVSLQISQDNPRISYYDSELAKIQLKGWGEGWEDIELPLNPISSPVKQTSLAFTSNRVHMSYSVNGLLFYLVQNGADWQVQLVDSPNVGDYNQLLALSDTYARIAYWDKANFRVKLAVLQADGSWQIHTHLEGPPLDYNSGYLSAAVLPEGKIGISYYDALQGDLRLAVWNPATGMWTDELIDGVAAYTGLLNVLQADGTSGAPVVAYYSSGADTIYYAYKDGETWQTEPAVVEAGGVTSLFLELGLNSLTRPQIAFTTYDGNLSIADKETGTWDVKPLLNNLTLGNVSLALTNRTHLAFTDLGLYYAFRSATLRVDPEIPGPPIHETLPYNPMDACIWFIAEIFDTEDDNPQPPLTALHPLSLGESTLMTDEAIFGGLHMLFAASPGGDYYIDRYLQHGSEMGQIALDDPQLLWDAYGTLQNFLPGLEALVQGQGNTILVTQEMVDDALDIWQRTAAVASPELAATINTELARYNNLQDFVGLTFAEWLDAIGGSAPDHLVYLPLIGK